ncbi:transcriptional regulator, MerR family [Clostridium sp. DL-VIII]|uniref:MerR family transcriptional regulator n=1 Tax=Clostridium sp. DL-VIII TaxID=641107 RepID=UPI00023AF6E5|nr:MerR family transcriptional regulator [Clostridium sp. DL-VIII]EHI96806.1 transcriptional regulator, MerR family [Clostridium sp. DL-VIII]
MSYSIKEVSQKLNISAYALRYYEREGLLPFVKRDNNGRRIYTNDDLGWIQLVNCMRTMGMSIAYIKNYVKLCVKGDETKAERRNIIQDQKDLIQKEIKKYTELLELVNLKLDYYDEKISRDEFKEIMLKKDRHDLI